jgi:hypothetical protein
MNLSQGPSARVRLLCLVFLARSAAMFARQARPAPRFQKGNLSTRYEFAAREGSVKEKDPPIPSDLRDIRRMSHDELTYL